MWADALKDIFMIDDMTEEVIYKGKKYEAIRYKKDVTQQLYDEGESNNITFSLLFWLDDFGSYVPQNGDKIISNNETYRIRSTSLDSVQKTITVNLGDEYD